MQTMLRLPDVQLQKTVEVLTMANKTLKEQATGIVGNAILEYLDKASDTNVLKLMNW